ncbi:enoyl-CoA hydratase/isomerase family protein [Thermodesulfobacteriota bacterium]
MGERVHELTNVAVHKTAAIATVTLNRPDVLNAASPDMMRDLSEALGIVANDDSVRAVIVNGAGSSFSAGGDIEKDVARLANMKPAEYKRYIQGFFWPVRQIAEMAKPVIAAIHGYVIGAGFDIAMSCDIRIAGQSAKLGNAYMKMGLPPLGGSLYFTCQAAGAGNAKYMLLTGDFIAAEEACRMGLIAKVVPDATLNQETMDLADRLAKGPTKTIAVTKLAVNKLLGMDFVASTDYCQNLALELFETEDHREALTAFREKRKPEFKGK